MLIVLKTQLFDKLIHRQFMFTIFRLIISIVVFLISLLAVFRAPTNFCWKISILLTEYSYVFIILFSLPLFSHWWLSKSGVASAIFSLIALGFAISPLLRAIPVINNLPDQVKNAFAIEPSLIISKNNFRRYPFVFYDSILGINKPPITLEKLCYKKTSETTETALDLNFYHSVSKDRKSPCILVIHGGGWNGGDKEQLSALNFYLAGQGYSVASIEYRLAPKNVFPAPVEDTKDAIKYIKDHSERLKVDTSNLILLGRSAGGQIALLTAYISNDPSIKGVISFYAPADMVWGYSMPGNPLILDSRLVMEQYLGGTYNKVPQVFKASSPNEFVSKNCPPTLLIHGIRDEMVSYEHSRRLDLLLETAGVKHLLVTLPWATHGCDYNFNGPSGQISTFAIERFIASVTKQ